MPAALTLLTDFGLRDAYVGALRGVLATFGPGVPLYDLSHEIAPQDVMGAAFVLRNSFRFYPPGTVHLAVVDPGVGTQRRAVALRAHGHLFVGPDNGLFSLVLGEEAPDELVVLDRPDAWRVPTPSPTFHGRDIFAPVAAQLALGTPLSDVGSPSEALRVLRWALPIAVDDGVRGRVVHVDRYGNAITNIEGADVQQRTAGRGIRTVAGGAIVRGLSHTYADVEPGDALVLVGSSGYVEIAVRDGNAAALLGLVTGTSVLLGFTDDARHGRSTEGASGAAAASTARAPR